MKLQYVGNGKEDPVKVKIYGFEFELNGAPVEIEDEKVAKKLGGNPTFRIVNGQSCAAQLEEAEKNDQRKEDGKFVSVKGKKGAKA